MHSSFFLDVVPIEFGHINNLDSYLCGVFIPTTTKFDLAKTAFAQSFLEDETCDGLSSQSRLCHFSLFFGRRKSVHSNLFRHTTPTKSMCCSKIFFERTPLAIHTDPDQHPDQQTDTRHGPDTDKGDTR
eukprot:m.28371 g.28371  ORF g.28371 m.28371 type:complete len:129 (-) comp15906_c1_seq1:217-603(-)